jgi:hypothetical protein
VPFSLKLGGGGGAGGEGGLGQAGVGADVPTSGCTATAFGHHCEGRAVAKVSSRQPSFTFDDGSILSWNDDGAETYVSPPPVVSENTYDVDYTVDNPPVCPFCGSSHSASLTVRSAIDGILWLGREGSFVGEVEPALIYELFGVPVRRELVCRTEPFGAGCYQVVRDVYDNVLETSIEQRVPHAVPVSVTTPNGSYVVMWASSDQTATFDTNCADGPSPAVDRGFAVSRFFRF